jgi:tetratricopeptide (TPR) repeat protein
LTPIPSALCLPTSAFLINELALMTLELTDWDQDLPSEPDEEYRALVRTLNFTEGFGLLFVRCSPSEGEDLIARVKTDIPQKNIHVLRLEESVDNLYKIVEELNRQNNINIFFITGLEHSFYEYEEVKKLAGWNSKDIYNYSWKSVPPVLINLNQQRERLKDNFNICFVFLLPIFAIKYFIQRAPDFFDWRSGMFEFPTNAETVKKESSRILEEGDYEKYLELTPEEKTQKILEIQELLEHNHQTPSNKPSLLRELGLLYAAAQEYEDAVASYEQALKIKADYHQAWNFRGYALGKLGRNEDAVASYKQALEIKADYHQAWNNLGNALVKLGRNEDAVASYDQVVKIKPDYHYAWNNRGYALGKLGRNEDAVASYDQAVKIKPDYHQAWNNWGYALGKLGRNEDAVASYDQALKIKPDYHQVWYNRGYALVKLGRYEDAVASYEQALKIKPDNHQAWYNRGIALCQLGRNEDAVASYDQAVKIKPDKHQAWYNKACSYALQGNIEQVIENLQKAINLNPDKTREMAKTNSNFDRIRDDERFQTLIQG